MATSEQIAAKKSGEIEIFKRKWAKRRAGRIKRGVEANLVTARPWLVSFDAREYTAVAGDGAAATMYLGIQRGVDAVTGQKRPDSHDRDPRRMVRSGRFASKIQRTKATGRIDRARCVIRGPSGGAKGKIYLDALLSEAKRKHFYFRFGGLVDKAMERRLRDWLEAHIGGKPLDISIARRYAREVITTGAKRSGGARVF